MHLMVVVAFSTRLNCILDIISVEKGVGLISCNFHLIFHFFYGSLQNNTDMIVFQVWYEQNRIGILANLDLEN